MDKIYLFVGLGAVSAALIALAVFVVVRLRQNKQEENSGLYWAYQDKWLLNAFDNYDCAVYGFRGTGKDVLFAHAINLKGGKHYSNIYYNGDTEVRDLKDLNVGGNTYEDFINGNTKKFEPNFEENYHFFISDAGVYLGCQYNKELNQNYGELPIHIALRINTATQTCTALRLTTTQHLTVTTDKTLLLLRNFGAVSKLKICLNT